MRLNILFYTLCFISLKCDAFFLFKDKKEPFLFCYKVCPLYCPDLLHNRRSDDESVSYIDEDYDAKSYHEEEHPSPAPKAYIYENTGHRPYTHIEHIPYPPYPDTHEPDYPDHASYVVEDKSHGSRACHGCHGHHGSHHHPWKHKPFEVEYNVKYVFKPIYPTSTTKTTTEPTTTKAPMTTPKELTGICYACLKKCYFYGYQ